MKPWFTQALVELKPHHWDLLDTESQARQLSDGGLAPLGPFDAAPSCRGMKASPQHKPIPPEGSENILGSEAWQPLLMLCLGGMVKIDIWDALLLLAFIERRLLFSDAINRAGEPKRPKGLNILQAHPSSLLAELWPTNCPGIIDKPVAIKARLQGLCLSPWVKLCPVALLMGKEAPSLR